MGKCPYPCRYREFGLTQQRSYGEADFKEDLRTLITNAASTAQCFLFCDADVKEEGFLEYINNILTVGMVPALFADDQKEALIAAALKSSREENIREDALWNYAINKARKNIHIILAMSPAGDSLRTRCRCFPGLVSCTSVDWFHPWPASALSAVAKVLLDNEDIPAEYREAIERHVVTVHSSVTQIYAPEYERKLNRITFATPQSYIDFLRTYRGMLNFKRHSIDQLSSRLEGGLQKMNSVKQTMITAYDLEGSPISRTDSSAAVCSYFAPYRPLNPSK